MATFRQKGELIRSLALSRKGEKGGGGRGRQVREYRRRGFLAGKMQRRKRKKDKRGRSSLSLR